MTEYLFRNEDLLDEVINTAIENNTFRSDDLEFTFAARVSSSFFLFLAVADENPRLVFDRNRLSPTASTLMKQAESDSWPIH